MPSQPITYEVFACSAAVFADALALYTESDYEKVVIVERMSRGVRFAGRSVWRKIPGQLIKVHWILRDRGGYVLPDCIRRVRD